LGTKSLKLDRLAAFLKIATQFFLRDMGNACVKLGNYAAAEQDFLAARDRFVERNVGPENWQKDIDVIEKKLKRPRALKP
jgi:hypothetical protein